MTEFWLPCPGFETVYRVSNMGRVQRISPAQGTHVGSFLKPVEGAGGYYTVTLSVKSLTTKFQVNRLVCETFHGPPPSSEHQAAHNNGDKSDNRSDNLRWATPKENQADRKIHGTSSITGRLPGEMNPKAKITRDDVHKIRELCSSGMFQVDIANRFGITQSAVSSILRRVTWRHI